MPGDFWGDLLQPREEVDSHAWRKALFRVAPSMMDRELYMVSHE